MTETGAYVKLIILRPRSLAPRTLQEQISMRIERIEPTQIVLGAGQGGGVKVIINRTDLVLQADMDRILENE